MQFTHKESSNGKLNCMYGVNSQTKKESNPNNSELQSTADILADKLDTMSRFHREQTNKALSKNPDAVVTDTMYEGGRTRPYI